MAQIERKKFPAPVVDYRKLRLHNLTSTEYRHLLMLVFWPIFGILFTYVEKHYPVEYYTPVHSVIDDFIPFFEWFVIPYLFWFVYLAGMVIYTALYDLSAFRKMMLFVIITYTLTIIIYLIWPNCQELRPTAFERDNIFTGFLYYFYQFDTNTNVCPSLHVVGSVAVWCTSLDMKQFKSVPWKLFFGITAFLICIATLFLKQHSVIDVIVAIPVCLIAYYFSFVKNKKRT